MAQTQAQLLAATKAQLAKTKARLQAIEDEQAILKAGAQSSTVDTTSLAGIEAASKGTTGYVPPVDTYSTAKVGSTGKTQAQIDALENARNTAALIRDTSTTMTSKVDPATGMVVTTPKGTTGGGAVLGAGSGAGSSGTPAGGNTASAIATAEAAKLKLLADQEAARIVEEKRRQGQSAYDLLLNQFTQYGLGSLVEDVKKYIQQGLSQSELTLRLRTESKAYQTRFAANPQRIAKGLSALNEAEYIGLEDQYQNIMREYGLPASYYAKGDLGVQSGFEKFLANDVSATELEDRVLTAQSRVINANPEVLASLKQFYPGISNGDILAYTLDPEKALTDIKRKVTAAEIGGSAMQAGLGISGTRAEELGAAGVTKQQAQQGFQTVAEVAPRGGQLAEIYKQSPYTQTTAEAEVFGLAGSTEAAKQRKKLTSLETAAFSGSAGAGAIARDRAGVL